ncbi:MAG: hypothetical protein DRJ51_03475 [Thermoprotei archaeon]|nr:MAG: hypothetical protein DRJ51_03475 [Thermoprotei archaeon]
MMGFLVIFKKELGDMVRSKRLLAIIAVLGFFLIAGYSVVKTLGTIRWPLLFMLRNLVTSLAFMAPVLGIAFGFDAISGEREKGTLKLVLAQPIYRDAFIVGKFVAFLALSLISFFASTFIAVGSLVVVEGLNVSLEDLGRLALISLAAILLSTTFYSISVLLSSVFKKTSHSALISVSIWIILTFVLPLVATLAARAILGPPPRIATAQNKPINPREVRRYFLRYRRLVESFMSLSPTWHFSQISNGLLISSMALPMGSERIVSLLDALSKYSMNFFILLLIPAIFFIASFAVFVKREEK